MNSIMNIVKPTFKPLCAKPVKQINKLKCPKTVTFQKTCKTKNREKYIREKVPQITAKEMVQVACEKRKNLVEICMKKARVMAQRKADRNTKEFNNYFM